LNLTSNVRNAVSTSGGPRYCDSVFADGELGPLVYNDDPAAPATTLSSEVSQMEDCWDSVSLPRRHPVLSSYGSCRCVSDDRSVEFLRKPTRVSIFCTSCHRHLRPRHLTAIERSLYRVVCAYGVMQHKYRL
jgi:hypothetical protein